MHDEDDYLDEDLGPSKSQIKREAEALKDMGRQLVSLRKDQLADFPLDDTLRDAVAEWHRIKSREAKRRQIQRLGKLLRETDVEPIQAALDRLDQSSTLATAELHTAERWRERMMNESDQAVAAFLAEHPAVDAQKLRQLIRNARRELEKGKPPRSHRELFRMIREQIRLE